jgi:hypothetical protein
MCVFASRMAAKTRVGFVGLVAHDARQRQGTEGLCSGLSYTPSILPTLFESPNSTRVLVIGERVYGATTITYTIAPRPVCESCVGRSHRVVIVCQTHWTGSPAHVYEDVRDVDLVRGFRGVSVHGGGAQTRKMALELVGEP